MSNPRRDLRAKTQSPELNSTTHDSSTKRLMSSMLGTRPPFCEPLASNKRKLSVHQLNPPQNSETPSIESKPIETKNVSPVANSLAKRLKLEKRPPLITSFDQIRYIMTPALFDDQQSNLPCKFNEQNKLVYSQSALYNTSLTPQPMENSQTPTVSQTETEVNTPLSQASTPVLEASPEETALPAYKTPTP